MENIIEADTLFVIVEFAEKNYENLPVIDLVPQSWVSIRSGKYFCRYPEKITAKISKWVKTQKEPCADWLEYPVTRIINQAKNYEQGVRRLNRALKTMESVVSTDTESTNLSVANNNNSNDVIGTETQSVNEIANHQLILDAALPVLDPWDKTLTNILNVDADGNNNEYELTPRDYKIIEILKAHIDGKIAECLKKMEKSERSILYDLNKKIDELKITFVQSPAAIGHKEAEARKTFGTALPIKILEEFLEFDSQLVEQKRDSFKTFCHCITVGSKGSKDSIAIIMNAIIAKPVQLQYSGCGRKTKGADAKLSFSATATFKCIKEFLEEKFVDSKEPLQITSHVSRWLAGAGDRDGGRRDRGNNTIDNGQATNAAV